MKAVTALVLASVVALSGCQSMGQKETAATMGGSVGRSLDDVDRLMAERTGSQALENYRTNETASWRNPDTGHQGSFTPTNTYQQADGTYCREFQQTITVGGEVHQGYGTACRQPDGTWQIRS